MYIESIVCRSGTLNMFSSASRKVTTIGVPNSKILLDTNECISSMKMTFVKVVSIHNWKKFEFSSVLTRVVEKVAFLKRLSYVSNRTNVTADMRPPRSLHNTISP